MPFWGGRVVALMRVALLTASLCVGSSAQHPRAPAPRPDLDLSRVHTKPLLRKQAGVMWEPTTDEKMQTYTLPLVASMLVEGIMLVLYKKKDAAGLRLEHEALHVLGAVILMLAGLHAARATRLRHMPGCRAYARVCAHGLAPACALGPACICARSTPRTFFWP